MNVALLEIIKHAQSPDLYEREEAVKHLGDIKDDISLGAIICSTKDKYWVVRDNALISLSKFVNQDNKNIISGCVLSSINDKNDIVRSTALEELYYLDKDIASHQALLMLEDSSYLVMGIAVKILGDMQDEKYLNKFEIILRGEHNIFVRQSCYYALYLLGKHGYLSKLLRCLCSRNYRIRTRTANMLADVNDAENISTITGKLVQCLEKEEVASVKNAIENTLNILRSKQ